MPETPRPADGFIFNGTIIESQKEEKQVWIDAKPLKAYPFREQSKEDRVIAKELCIVLGLVNRNGRPKQKLHHSAVHLVCNYRYRALTKNPSNPHKFTFRYSCNHSYLIEAVSGFTNSILDFIAFMAEKGWIEDKRQTQTKGLIEGVQSTFNFTPAFDEWFKSQVSQTETSSNKTSHTPITFGYDNFIVVKENSPNKSRDVNKFTIKKPVNLDSNPKRREKRRINNILMDYNALLARSNFGLRDLSLCSEEPSQDLKKAYYSFDKFNLVDNIRVQRQYADEQLNTHGRFYGGFWQSMPSILRGHILTNGNATVECDYKSMQPNILFGLTEHKPLAKDVYSVPFYDENSERFDYSRPKYDRKLIKDCFMLLINSKRPKQTFINNISARVQGELFFEQEMYSSYSLENNLEALIAKCNEYKSEEFRFDLYQSLSKAWKPIWHYFEEDGINWRQLTRYDSDVAFEVIKDMTALNIPILTIHDSFIVEQKHCETLKDVMIEAYTRIIQPLNNVVPAIEEKSSLC